MQILHNWLNGSRNFTTGSILYQTFGANHALKDLLAKGETPFAKKELIQAIEKLVAPGEVITLPEPALAKEAEVMPNSDDEILIAIKCEWDPLFQRMNLLRHELDQHGSSNTDEAIAWRQPRAKEVKQLEQQCMAIWAKRDYYIKEGKLPFVQETKIEIPTDPVKLANLINNLKRNIRRNKDLMTKFPGCPQFAQYYQEYKASYKQVTGKDYAEKNSL